MNTILQQLKYNDFEVKGIESYQMTFENNNRVDYSQIPRRKNLLHLVTGGRRLYEINGRVFSVESGTLLFIPHNTRYITTAVSCGGEHCSGIGICFDMNVPFRENECNIYHTQVAEPKERVFALFQNVCTTQQNAPLELLEIKCAFYKLLSFLTTTATTKPQEYDAISAAVDYITIHFRENLSVKQYADACNLSESYFRKIFCACFGKSPIAYRNQLRFIEAKRLYQNKYSTAEIAEQLGFCDAGYMLKLYKRYTGRTLKADAKIL